LIVELLKGMQQTNSSKSHDNNLAI